MRLGWIVLFWALQVTAHLVFTQGAAHPTRWWLYAVGGNVFGVSSTLALMKAYTVMNANLAMALCLGGGFLLTQAVLFVSLRSRLSLPQVAGILAIALGMSLLAATRPAKPSPATPTSVESAVHVQPP